MAASKPDPNLEAAILAKTMVTLHEGDAAYTTIQSELAVRSLMARTLRWAATKHLHGCVRVIELEALAREVEEGK